MVIDTALDCNLDVIALTDHDNILSHKAAYDYVQKNNINIEIIPGVEINTIYKGYEVHILGVFYGYRQCRFSKSYENAAAGKN